MTNSFGAYLREMREKKGLPLRKVAAHLDIDTSILSKIERDEKEVQTKFIVYSINKNYGDMTFLKDGLNTILKSI